jgi:uncharacterized protein (TIGR00645 family)
VSETREVERRISQVLFGARWLMAPIYLGLALALVALTVVFVHDLIQFAPSMWAGNAEESILGILTLIDLALTGNLLLIVIYSGYEGFVSKLYFGGGADRPAGIDSVDFSSIKLNLLASTVGISSIYLLRWFMEVGEESSTFDERRLRWLVVIHLTFVVSSVMIAFMDWLSARAEKHP